MSGRLHGMTASAECGSMDEWFVAHVASAAPRFLVPWLKHLGGSVQIFTHMRQRRKKSPVRVESFPGYLFVNLPDTITWGNVRELPGLIRWLSVDGRRPTALRSQEVQRIADFHSLFFMEDSPALTKVTFPVGTIVKIMAGPFTSFEAVCLEDDGIYVKVNVSIFGRSTLTTMKRSDVAAGAAPVYS